MTAISENQAQTGSLMRLILIGFCVASLLSLTACVTVPEQTQLMQGSLELEPTAECVAPGATELTASGLPADGFSIISWNIYKQQKAGWAGDLAALSVEADILLLQEAFLDQDLQDWLGNNMAHWDMNPAFRYRATYAGVMTAGRLPPSSRCGLRMLEPLTGLPKTALLSFYPIENHPDQLLVINIHGVNFTVDTVHLEKQLNSVGDIIESHQGPVVLAGDFNTWSSSRTELLGSLASRLQLKQIMFEGQQPSSYLGYRIDHVYYRGLKPLDGGVRAVTSSDHYPLRVRFSLEG